ncbi:hypothetical protein KEJ17_07485 [Candidatus Bathyarchaeota archaeon]|nr:hypothetical protein [Candidatus Bathyarchaeota archaeon]
MEDAPERSPMVGGIAQGLALMQEDAPASLSFIQIIEMYQGFEVNSAMY